MSSYLSRFNYQIYAPAKRSPLPTKYWVFLHGLMGYGQNWRKIAQALTQQSNVLNYVLVFDQRGHGKSMKPLTGYAPDDYAEDLALILDELANPMPSESDANNNNGEAIDPSVLPSASVLTSSSSSASSPWSKIILVGHSMGGRNALMFASKFPERLEKLIIVDIGPDSRPEAPNYYKGLLEMAPTPFVSKQSAKQFFYNEFPKLAKSFKQPQTLGAYLYSNIDENPDGSADWRFSKEAMIQSVVQGRAQDHWRELRALSMPTLVVRGSESEDLTKDEFQRMCLANPRIHGVEIPQAGHWVHFDRPQEFLQALLDFVK